MEAERRKVGYEQIISQKKSSSPRSFLETCRHVVAWSCLLHLRAETGFLHLKKPIHHCWLSTETVKSQSVLDWIFIYVPFIIVIFL